MLDIKTIFLLIFLWYLEFFVDGLKYDDKMIENGSKNSYNQRELRKWTTINRLKTREKEMVCCKRNKKKKLKCKHCLSAKNGWKIVTKEMMMELLSDYFEKIRHIG